jgi:hypothetical protein
LGPGGGVKRPAIISLSRELFLKLYNIAHSESMVDKWNNSASGTRTHTRSTLGPASFLKANEMNGAKSVHFFLRTILMRALKYQTTSLLTPVRQTP